ncbi:hypothetical protein THAOC_21098 [Thalassiosira oceanica]|uniref:Uncharacterized protein n=1 Tax=Thalassiosira oceanica TaxID=159749 RepID=K0S0D6_THAOC|nr:hypothetical protein THAOC_21098 [Thalassiosira oceanica]|eukprot:EJK58755.1 hypothetical protein THAOC_21098 [Thalassiosira oceanica]
MRVVTRPSGRGHLPIVSINHGRPALPGALAEQRPRPPRPSGFVAGVLEALSLSYRQCALPIIALGVSDCSCRIEVASYQAGPVGDWGLELAGCRGSGIGRGERRAEQKAA